MQIVSPLLFIPTFVQGFKEANSVLEMQYYLGKHTLGTQP